MRREENERRTILNLCELCEMDPDAGLELIEQAIKKKPQLALNPLIKFAKAIAYGNKGLFNLVRSKPRIDWTTFDEEELRGKLGVTDAHLDYLELALQEIREIEKINPKALKVFVTDELGRAKVDAIATVLERCRPGRVQELLGKTKLFYFGPSRVFIHNDCKITKEEFVVFRDIFFTPREIAKSAILRLDGVDDKGRRYVVVVLYKETNPLASEEVAGFICLYDDGTSGTFPPER